MTQDERLILYLTLQYDGHQEHESITQDADETISHFLKRGAIILDVGAVGRGLQAKAEHDQRARETKTSKERRHQVDLPTGQRQFLDGDKPEFCAACGEHISRHFGGLEYRCDPLEQGGDLDNEATLFSRRPRKTKVCDRCGGEGRESEGYAIAHLAIRDPRLPDYAVHALVVGSATIFEATREARAIADECRRPVAFVFL